MHNKCGALFLSLLIAFPSTGYSIPDPTSGTPSEVVTPKIQTTITCEDKAKTMKALWTECKGNGAYLELPACETAAQHVINCCSDPLSFKDCGLEAPTSTPIEGGISNAYYGTVDSLAKKVTVLNGSAYYCQKAIQEMNAITTCKDSPEIVSFSQRVSEVVPKCFVTEADQEEQKMKDTVVAATSSGAALEYHCESPPVARFHFCTAFPSGSDSGKLLTTASDFKDLPAEPVQVEVTSKEGVYVCSGSGHDGYVLSAGHCMDDQAQSYKTTVFHKDGTKTTTTAVPGKSTYTTTGHAYSSQATTDVGVLQTAAASGGGTIATPDWKMTGDTCQPAGSNGNTVILHCPKGAYQNWKGGPVTIIDFADGQTTPRVIHGYGSYDAALGEFHFNTKDVEGSSGAGVIASNFGGYSNVEIAVVSGGPQVGQSDAPPIPFETIAPYTVASVSQAELDSGSVLFKHIENANGESRMPSSVTE